MCQVSVPGLKSKGFVPMEHLTDFTSLAGHLFKCYSVGDVIKEAVVWSSSELQTILTLKPSIVQFVKEDRFPKSFDEVQVNASYPVVLAKHRDFGVFATLLSPPGSVEPLFPISKLPPLVYRHVKTGRDVSLEGKVITIDAEKKRITLSGLDEDVGETSAELLDNYLQHLEKIRSHYASKAGADDQLKALANLNIGDPVVAKLDVEVDASNDLVFQLPSGLKAVVPKYHRGNKKLKKGDIVAGAVLHCDLIERLVYVTVRDDVINQLTRLSSSSVTGTHIKSTILLRTDFFSLVSTNKENVQNYAYVSNIRNINQVCAKIVPPFKVGDTTLVDVVESSGGRVAVYHKKPKKWEAKKRPAQSEDGPESKKAKSDQAAETAVDEPKQKQQKKENSREKTVNNEDNEKTRVEGTKKAEKQSKKEKAAAAAAAAKNVTASDDEKPDEGSPLKKRRVETSKVATAKSLRNPDALTLPRLAVSAFKWDDDYATLPLAANVQDSSDSEEDDNDDKKKKNEKMSVKDRRERAKQKLEDAKREEARLSKIEDELTDPNRAPAAADDFDRMVLSSPNSSILWLQYMAFHLENAEIEKARAVAQRALKTISFREEQEKFNVWIGLLNLEHMYGTSEVYEETFQVKRRFPFAMVAVLLEQCRNFQRDLFLLLLILFDFLLQEALRYNEPFKVYRQMSLNFEQSGKVDEAESLHTAMMKKFKQDKSVWLNSCVFYVRNAKLDTARSVFQKALTILDKRDRKLASFVSTLSIRSRFAKVTAVPLKNGAAELLAHLRTSLHFNGSPTL